MIKFLTFAMITLIIELIDISDKYSR